MRWLKRCGMIHVTLSEDDQLEETITLLNEVREVLHSEAYAPLLPTSMLRIKVEDVPASELRGWLFQVYSTCQDYESYEAFNDRTRKYLSQELSSLHDEN